MKEKAIVKSITSNYTTRHFKNPSFSKNYF